MLNLQSSPNKNNNSAKAEKWHAFFWLLINHIALHAVKNCAKKLHLLKSINYIHGVTSSSITILIYLFSHLGILFPHNRQLQKVKSAFISMIQIPLWLGYVTPDVHLQRCVAFIAFKNSAGFFDTSNTEELINKAICLPWLTHMKIKE